MMLYWSWALLIYLFKSSRLISSLGGPGSLNLGDPMANVLNVSSLNSLRCSSTSSPLDFMFNKFCFSISLLLISFSL